MIGSRGRRRLALAKQQGERKNGVNRRKAAALFSANGQRGAQKIFMDLNEESPLVEHDCATHIFRPTVAGAF